MRSGVELFNQQKYWECHEVFEDLWAEDAHDPARYVYWAIIQVAAVCIHVREKNLIGASSMLMKARGKFAKCLDPGIRTQVMNDYLDWKILENIVASIPLKPELSDFETLSRFKFEHFPKESSLP